MLLPAYARAMVPSPSLALRLAAAGLGLLATTGGCSGSSPTPEKPAAITPRPIDVELPIDRWTAFAPRGRGAVAARTELADGSTLELIDGLQVHTDAAGRLLGVEDAPVSARGVSRVPDKLGGGVAFFGSGGAALAPSPLAPAKVLTQQAVRDLSFGPRGALVLFEDGRRGMLDPRTGAASPLSPPNMVGVALADDGFTAALLEGGRLLISRDAGATYEASPSPGTFVELFTTAGAIHAVDVEGALLHVTPTALVPVAAPPARPFDPRWPHTESPLELAVRDGALLDPDHAIVAARGSVHEIDLRRGAVKATEAGVLPVNRPCATLSLSSEILFACPDDGRLAIFTRPRDRPGVRLERTFAGQGRLVRGGGDALLYAGTCQGDTTKAGRACVRGKEGWTSIDRAKLFEGEKPAVLLAWVPTATSALAILGGQPSGILDAATGERTVVEGPEGQRLATIISPRSEAVEHRFHVVDGAIEGWARDESWIRIANGGKTIEPAPFRMQGVRIAGPHALAMGPDETLWQSSDWGRTFREVATPPARLGHPSACSAAGCTFGRWVRAGWDESTPVGRPPPRTAAPARPDRAPALPELRCGTAGPQVRRAVAEGGERPPGLGAELLGASDAATVFRPGPADPSGRVESGSGLGAVETGPASAVAEDGRVKGTTSRAVRYVVPFDPAGALRSARFDVAGMIDAAHRAAIGPLDGNVLAAEGLVLPVLGAARDDAEVLLLRDVGIATWVRARGAPIQLATTSAELDVGTPTAAVRSGEELAVLFTQGNGDATVLRLGAGRAERLFAMPTVHRPDASPRTVDTLALGADGAVAVLRVPTAGPPDAADPAWLLRADGTTQPLAAWSTLAADGAPGCEAARGARAIVTTDVPWIQLGPARRTTARSVMRVRWSEERVCLEAGEIFSAEHDTPQGSARSRVVVTFGARPQAGLVLVDAGVELREPRTCVLGL